jgi:L-histidine N-alpha-methyltransferase
MTTQVLLPLADTVLEQVSEAVRLGLSAKPKSLPPWLFYDEAGSRLFEQITELDEYYLTRTERSIFAAHAAAILAEAVRDLHDGDRVQANRGAHACDAQTLRIVELGAGSADKTRLLLLAAVEREGSVVYEPVDVSASALEAACVRIEREIPEVLLAPRVIDYTRDLELDPTAAGERRLVIYIGSSIGNFEPEEAIRLLCRVRARLRSGDGILLGVDLRKDERALLAAYNDSAGVTAAFNLNLLARLNRELGANFNPSLFAHRAVWNDEASRIEMHLECQASHIVRIPALDLEIAFAEGETIHTENSYKFPPGGAEAMLSAACFTPAATWTDPHSRFAVCLGQVE